LKLNGMQSGAQSCVPLVECGADTYTVVSVYARPAAERLRRHGPLKHHDDIGHHDW
jgi:hypothetical protein